MMLYLLIGSNLFWIWFLSRERLIHHENLREIVESLRWISGTECDNILTRLKIERLKSQEDTCQSKNYQMENPRREIRVDPWLEKHNEREKKMIAIPKAKRI